MCTDLHTQLVHVYFMAPHSVHVYLILTVLILWIAVLTQPASKIHTEGMVHADPNWTPHTQHTQLALTLWIGVCKKMDERNLQ